MRKSLLTLTFLAVCLAELCGQSFYAVRRQRSLMVVGGTGTSTYVGELSNPGDYLDAKPNLTAGLQFFINNHISVRAEAVWFNIKGADELADDQGRINRNLSFHANNFEINSTAAVSFFPNGNRHYRRPSFNLYAFGGIGVMYFNPKAKYQGENVALRPLETEGVRYGSIGLVIPYGLGTRLKLSPIFNLSIEGGYRKTFTDYLDDVSTVYLDNNSFTDPIAQALADRRPELTPPQQPWPAGHKRGNPDSMDGYFLLNAKLEYYLPVDFVNQRKSYTKKKRNAFYRYNKRGGGVKRRR